MVLAEGMAAGLDILASGSGAIPEVLQGQGTLFAPGDWPSLAGLLEEGPLARAPGRARVLPRRARGALLDGGDGREARRGLRPP